MSGVHRARKPGKARVAVAGALTAGTLLLAPAGVAVIATPAVASATPAKPPPKVPKPPSLKSEFKKLIKELKSITDPVRRVVGIK